MNYSDFELIDRVLNGNAGCFEELVSRYRKSVYALVFRMVHNHEDAADLSQETFFKVYQGLKKFEKKSSFHTWLYRITINLCINHLRKAKNWQYVELDHTQSVQPAEVLDKIALAELQTKIDEAVRALPEKQRAAVVLRLYHGLSHQEIAEILGCSVGTVKANYFHAIRNLRQSIDYAIDFEKNP